ncbi:putative glycosidase CRH2 [Batrachochytrium dendrobatidis]|nr:putative glycosidase CRH2 [Batrachochytrium dendrobatidis]
MYSLSPVFALTLLAAKLILTVMADPSTQGNCITGRITFDEQRTSKVPMHVDMPAFPPSIINIVSTDTTIDYAPQNVKFMEGGGVTLSLTKNDNATATGTRISSSRYMLYGRITARIKAVPYAGAITTFITMSESKDEIDWEMVGSETNVAQTNVFYKGIQEFGVHSTSENLTDTSQWHEYTIDWKHDSLTWSVDGTQRRKLDRTSSLSPMTPPGEYWFPTTPSRVQVSVWDAGSSPDKGTSRWGGGPIPWGSEKAISAQFEYIDIQCYNDDDQPVKKWPADASNPDRDIDTPIAPVSIPNRQVDPSPTATSTWGESLPSTWSESPSSTWSESSSSTWGESSSSTWGESLPNTWTATTTLENTNTPMTWTSSSVWPTSTWKTKPRKCKARSVWPIEKVATTSSYWVRHTTNPEPTQIVPQAPPIFSQNEPIVSAADTHHTHSMIYVAFISICVVGVMAM